MKSRLLRSAALPALLAGQSLFAYQALAQQPAPAAHNWTGFTIGGNIGGAWGNSSANSAANCNVPALGATAGAYFCDSAFGAANGAAYSAAGSGSIHSSGFTGGLEAGYNWQVAPFAVLGAETDFGVLHLRGSRQGSGVFPFGLFAPAGIAFTANSAVSTDWLNTYRARFGVPIASNFLAFATGGLALTRLSVSDTYADARFAPPGGVEAASRSAVRAGWVIGGGVEWALTSNWSVKAEYLYLDFGKLTANGFITNANQVGYTQGISTQADLTAQVARLGVDYKF